MKSTTTTKRNWALAIGTFASGLMLIAILNAIPNKAASIVVRPALLGTAGAPPANEAVTSYTPPGANFNNFDGDIGFRFVPDANMTITHVGRWKLSGNSQSHTFRIINNSGTDIGSGTVDFSGGAGTVGQLNYSSITPVSLTSGQTYYIVSHESNGGDTWYSDNGTVTFNAHFSSVKGTFIPNGGGLNFDADNNTYAPVSFKFTIP